MNKYIYTIIILLAIFILLVSIDLITGLWFWNRNNLIFSSTEFNNIVTPSLTILATIIYGAALFTTINQNKIILSQNIKPFYEKEIEKYISKAVNIKISSVLLFPNEDINVNNYIRYIMETLELLAENKDYNEDYEKFLNKEELTKPYILARSYVNEAMFLTKFTIGISDVTFFYDEILDLIQEINDSKLILEDKILLKKQIHRTFLKEYMTFIETNDKHNNLFPKMPIIYSRPREANVFFQNISDTNFRNPYLSFFNEYNVKQ